MIVRWGLGTALECWTISHPVKSLFTDLFLPDGRRIVVAVARILLAVLTSFSPLLHSTRLPLIGFIQKKMSQDNVYMHENLLDLRRILPYF